MARQLTRARRLAEHSRGLLDSEDPVEQGFVQTWSSTDESIASLLRQTPSRPKSPLKQCFDEPGAGGPHGGRAVQSERVQTRGLTIGSI